MNTLNIIEQYIRDNILKYTDQIEQLELDKTTIEYGLKSIEEYFSSPDKRTAENSLKMVDNLEALSYYGTYSFKNTNCYYYEIFGGLSLLPDNEVMLEKCRYQANFITRGCYEKLKDILYDIKRINEVNDVYKQVLKPLDDLLDIDNRGRCVPILDEFVLKQLFRFIGDAFRLDEESKLKCLEELVSKNQTAINIHIQNLNRAKARERARREAQTEEIVTEVETVEEVKTSFTDEEQAIMDSYVQLCLSCGIDVTNVSDDVLAAYDLLMEDDEVSLEDAMGIDINGDFYDYFDLMLYYILNTIKDAQNAEVKDFNPISVMTKRIPYEDLQKTINMHYINLEQMKKYEEENEDLINSLNEMASEAKKFASSGITEYDETMFVCTKKALLNEGTTDNGLDIRSIGEKFDSLKLDDITKDDIEFVYNFLNDINVDSHMPDYEEPQYKLLKFIDKLYYERCNRIYDKYITNKYSTEKLQLIHIFKDLQTNYESIFTLVNDMYFKKKQNDDNEEYNEEDNLLYFVRDKNGEINCISWMYDDGYDYNSTNKNELVQSFNLLAKTNPAALHLNTGIVQIKKFHFSYNNNDVHIELTPNDMRRIRIGSMRNAFINLSAIMAKEEDIKEFLKSMGKCVYVDVLFGKKNDESDLYDRIGSQTTQNLIVNLYLTIKNKYNEIIKNKKYTTVDEQKKAFAQWLTQECLASRKETETKINSYILTDDKDDGDKGSGRKKKGGN